MGDEETPFYEGPGVMITKARAVFLGTTYPMTNITSVRMREEPRPPVWMLLAACFSVLGAIALKPLPDVGPVLFVIGVACIAIYALHPVKFWVCIGAAGGETNACSYKSREAAQEIIDALNDAIVTRG